MEDGCRKVKDCGVLVLFISEKLTHIVTHVFN
jgi:hypothetical protein